MTFTVETVLGFYEDPIKSLLEQLGFRFQPEPDPCVGFGLSWHKMIANGRVELTTMKDLQEFIATYGDILIYKEDPSTIIIVDGILD